MKNTPANNPTKRNRASKEERSSRALTGSAKVSGAPPRSGAGGWCANCGSTEDFEDVCDECRKEFGDLCQTDGNGYNCTCQHCENNTYDTQCLTCGHDERAGVGEEDSDSEPGHSPSGKAEARSKPVVPETPTK